MVRPRFDRRDYASKKYVATRDFQFNGKPIGKGDPFPIDGMALHNVMSLYGSRYIGLAPDVQEPEEHEVTLAQLGGGYYEIRAAWLDKPEKVKGKAKAEARAKEIDDGGPPLGFIEGGSEVTIEDHGGGWYDVSAPWLDEPDKVQGRDAAEQRQRELHAGGEPAYHHGVRILDGENGWYGLKADWADKQENVQGEDKARERAAELRAEGPPPVDVAALVTMTEQDGKQVVSAPWLDQPETFDTVEEAEARKAALVESGVPDGFELTPEHFGAVGGTEPQDGHESDAEVVG